MHFEKIFVPDNYTGTAHQAFSTVSSQYEEAMKHLETQKQNTSDFSQIKLKPLFLSEIHFDSFPETSMYEKLLHVPENMRIFTFSAVG